MERAADRQVHRAQSQLLGGLAAPAGSASAGPESTTWVGQLSLATARPCCGRQFGARSAAAAPEQRHHAPRLRLSHQPPAEHDQLQSVALRQRVGGHQRRQLAERMPGHHVLQRLAELGPAGQAGAEDRGLGELGALLDPLERVLPIAVPASSSRSGRTRSTVSRMSGDWLPWPGNRIAVRLITLIYSIVGPGYSVALAVPRTAGAGAAPAGEVALAAPCRSPPPSDNSTALVTGASAGIGAEIARELAGRGHGVVLVARRKQKLLNLAERAHRRIRREGRGISCDLGKPRPARQAPRVRSPQLGLEVEILINNAGFATGGPFAASDPERELEQVRVLVEAVVALTSAFLPGMVEARPGRRS